MRKSTLAILIWTGLCAVWLITGLGAAAPGAAASDAYAAGAAIGATFIVFVWFLVLIPLAIVWFATRPKDNVMVFGPNGQQVMVSEKEARKRVEGQGWSYQKT